MRGIPDGDKRKSSSGKNVGEESESQIKKQKKLISGHIDMATAIAKANAKAYKATDKLPEGATPSVYASLFTSSSVGTRTESYGARNLSFTR